MKAVPNVTVMDTAQVRLPEQHHVPDKVHGYLKKILAVYACQFDQASSHPSFTTGPRITSDKQGLLSTHTKLQPTVDSKFSVACNWQAGTGIDLHVDSRLLLAVAV